MRQREVGLAFDDYGIGILGSGRVATAPASKLVQGGYAVVLGTRDPQAAAARWKGPAVPFAPPEEATRRATIVNDTPGDSSLERLRPLVEALAGNVLLDVANATCAARAAETVQSAAATLMASQLQNGRDRSQAQARGTTARAAP